jgi:hypothetical protein
MRGMDRAAVLLPFEAGPHRLAMGLTAIPADALVMLDASYAGQMEQRLRLLDSRREDVFAALAAADGASAEVLALLGALLPRRFPEVFARTGGRLRNTVTGEAWALADPPAHPLEVAGRLVQEDLCLVTPEGRLEAAVLCFPSRWRLAEKIGRDLGAIHAPVPGYAARLARPVGRFFAQLRPGRVVERVNWSVLDDPALFQPGGKGRSDANAAVTPANAGETLVLRVERQTLLRLATHVLFTIRLQVTPLARAITRPADAARLAAAVRALPPDMALYKSLPAIAAPLLAWLDARAVKIDAQASGDGVR